LGFTIEFECSDGDEGTMIGLFALGLFGTFMIVVVGAILAKKLGPAPLVGLFSGLIVITSILAVKLINIGWFLITAEVFIYSATFLVTDMLSEFFGKEEARKAVITALLVDILLVFAVWLAVIWPPAAEFAVSQSAFQEVLGTTWRIVAASIAGFVIAQTHDVWAFHFWKRIFRGKHLWVRNNLSTVVSQLIDGIVFYTIAFYGVIPVFPLVIGSFPLRAGIAALDTPFIYVARWLYRVL
jgi:queuosine precursor transporter